jgi:hypothetical protein
MIPYAKNIPKYPSAPTTIEVIIIYSLIFNLRGSSCAEGIFLLAVMFFLVEFGPFFTLAFTR